MFIRWFPSLCLVCLSFLGELYLQTMIHVVSRLSVIICLQIKQKENDMALKYYLKVVKAVEELNWEQRQFALVKGLLAGNVFDWGAKAVSE